MACPVCGNPETVDVCARCGTDLRALDGDDGEVRLEVALVAAPAMSGRRTQKA